MPLPRLHLWVGLLAIAGFIATGFFLFFRLDGLAAHNDSIRWMFRSNHIYILLSGLINLALSRDVTAAAGWRERVRMVGSAFALSAPFVLGAAFAREPAAADPVRILTKAGVILLVIGTIARVSFARTRA